MKLLAPLDQFRQSEADRAAHHAVMGNLLSLHVSIHQRGADPKKRVEELIDPGRDGVGEQVGIEPGVIERVPLPEPLQSDLQLVLATARLPGQNLLRERVHAGRGLARTDGSKDGYSGVQSPLLDGEPRGDRLQLRASNQTRQIVMRNSPPVRTPMACVA